MGSIPPAKGELNQKDIDSTSQVDSEIMMPIGNQYIHNESFASSPGALSND
jgi:hypothetical protein